MESLVVNPSVNVSPYCYSLLRIEPYTSCMHQCIYCFGRWYRMADPATLAPTPNMIQSLVRIFKAIHKRGLTPMPFRLSTLIDPFQPIELEKGASKHVIKLCIKYNIPLIINTKAPNIAINILPLLEKLCNRGLLIFQVSVSVISGELAKKLEPKAPPPQERLDAAEKMSKEGIPVILRLQPLIPGLMEHDLELTIQQAKYIGTKQIITEALRDEIENFNIYSTLAKDSQKYKGIGFWEDYSATVKTPSKVLRPKLEWRISTYKQLRDLCSKYGLAFSMCKEGLYELQTAKNCCGINLLNPASYTLRPTLYEAWIIYKQTKTIPSYKQLVETLPPNYIHSQNLKPYPRTIRKKLQAHEKILKQILEERTQELIKLLPR
ncbi:MAG: radical SAM protein [Candidatus Bathyarchaeia archaeon]